MLTCCHRLQGAHHHAVKYLTSDSLYEGLIFLCVLSHVHQQLSKCKGTNREGMDDEGAGDKALSVEQL